MLIFRFFKYFDTLSMIFFDYRPHASMPDFEMLALFFFDYFCRHFFFAFR